MERREKTRFARRLQVHFWKRGEEKAFSGYTANISKEGMFIGTASPLPRGTRLRIEVLDQTLGFMVEGIVAHAARVSPQLQKLRASGMGIRFLKVEELVGELMPTSRPRTKPTSRDHDAKPAEAEPPKEEETREEEPVEDGKRKLTPLPDDGPRSRKPVPEPRVYPLRFSSLPNFLSVLQRDIEKGGVFIPTDEPAEMREKILVEVQVPSPVDRAVQFEAVVVGLSGTPGEDAEKEKEGKEEKKKSEKKSKKKKKEEKKALTRDENEAGDDGDNLLRGMAVEFTDAKGAFDALTEIVYGD